MSTQTARLQLEKPGLPENVELAILNANYDKIDAKIGAVPCTSGARPANPFDGLLALETDTNNLIVYESGWHVVGTYDPWNTASFGANWDNNTLGRGTCRYKRTGNNTVMLSGVAKRLTSNATVGNIIMTLPAGYRPPIGHMAGAPIVEGPLPGVVTVGTDGTVKLEMDVLQNQHVVLTGIEVPLS